MHVSKDLQANHKMIRFLEEAKAQSEMVLDALPGVFAVIDHEGRIFRGNSKIADLLNIEFESLAGCRFDQLVNSKDWPVFLFMLNQAKNLIELEKTDPRLIHSWAENE